MCSRFYQWYQWYTNIVQGSTNCTISNTIGTNGNANGTIGSPNGTIGTIGKPMVPLAANDTACVHGSTNGIPISFKVLPMVPLVIPLVPMVPLVKTDGRQYCRQSTVWAKLPTLGNT